jgi:ABC-type sugar transport system ATPase subunit
MDLIRLFNESAGQEYLKEQGVSEDVIEQLSLMGISGVANMISAIKFAKYNDLTENDIVEFMIGDKIESTQYSTKRESNEVVMKVNGITNKNVSDINFNLYKNEVLGFYGLVGSGRTELIKILFGVDKYERGNMRIHDKEYKPQNPNEAIKFGLGLVPEKRKDF